MNPGVYPDAYIDYLVHFHGDRDYFECHEILEEYWKEHPGDPLAKIWVALIQLAVSAYHERRGNRGGAVKMLRKALENAAEDGVARLGLDARELRRQAEERLSALERAERQPPYADPQLPIADGELLRRAQAACAKRGWTWGAPSNLADRGLTERHTLRDRSGVLAERQAQLALRRQQQTGQRGETR